MRICVSAGHNVYINNSFDCGAVGNGKRESDITRETVSLLIPLLERQGHKVLDVTPYDKGYSNKKAHHLERCKKADNFKADLYLDIHINAGGGSGVEAWVYSKNSKSYPYADKICKSISKNIKLKNRGVKINPAYWSLKYCKAPAIIVEGCFIDSKYDIQRLNPENYALSVAKCFGDVLLPNRECTYKVQVGAFKEKNNALKLQSELKKKGFDSFIKVE